LLAWSTAEHLVRGPSDEERQSALRKFYLYAVVFSGVVGTVLPFAMILAGAFRRVLGLPLTGGLEGPLPIIPVMATVWAYHARAVRDEAYRAGEMPRQAAVRRLYRYLVAGVGLGAFLVGVAGVTRVIVRAASASALGTDLRNTLAWSAAILLCGLPVWLWQWSRAQSAALAPGPDGALERRSVVRRLYLYAYLFVATVTVLSGAVYLVFRLMSAILGASATTDMPTRFAEAIAYTLIGVVVWLYHGKLLRDDGRRDAADRASRLATMPTVVLDAGDGVLGRALLQALRAALPGLPLLPVGLTTEAARAMGDESTGTGLAERLSGASVVVAPWQVTVPGVATDDETAATVTRALAVSAARKIVLPTTAPGWDWAGVDRHDQEDLIRQAVHAVGQVAEGEPVTPARPLGAGQILAIVVVGLIAFFVVVMPIVSFILGSGMAFLGG
jgi:hypothetical protein